MWNAQAAQWARFVHAPDHDRVNERLNVPTLCSLLPAGTGKAIDVGCGEGRFARELERLGWRVVGIDSSAAMVAFASESVEAIVADAADLPFQDDSFDLVTAFMSLQDMDEPEAAVSEAGRVLKANGHFCFCITHPFESSGAFAERAADAAFVVHDYFGSRRMDSVHERDGIVIDFAKMHRPLEAYVGMLESAGFLIEALRETVHPRELWRDAASARWTRIPTFLHIRAVKL